MEFLRNDLPILLEDMSIEIELQMRIFHNDAPPQFQVEIRIFLIKHKGYVELDRVDQWLGLRSSQI